MDNLKLDPPIEIVSSIDDELGYSAILNACYHPSNPVVAVQETLTMLVTTGFTQNQISRYVSKAKALGVQYPVINDLEIEQVLIEVDKKISKLDASNIFQNIADKFLLYIYGKKFNDGVHGAFGKEFRMNYEPFRVQLRILDQMLEGR